jgi:5'-3' exonuclease
MKLLIDADIIIYRCAWACKDNYWHQLRACNTTVERVLERFDGSPYDIIISGSNNFRKKISPEYKSNRKHKPPNLYDIYQHFLKYWRAEQAEGEADDLIASLHDSCSIIVSSDKDFKQLGGKIYNPWKDEIEEIHNPYYWWWMQMCCGDSADVVKTLPGIGPKKAEKILDGKSPSEMKEAVENKYKEFYGEGWFEKFDITARLLWLKRSPTSEYYDGIH